MGGYITRRTLARLPVELQPCIIAPTQVKGCKARVKPDRFAAMRQSAATADARDDRTNAAPSRHTNISHRPADRALHTPPNGVLAL